MPRRFTRPLVILIAVLLASCGAIAAERQPWTPVSDLWYAVELAAARAGHMRVVTEQKGDIIRTTTTTKMSIARAGSDVTAITTSIFQERSDGTPIQYDYSQELSNQALRTTLVFNKNDITVTARQGDHSNTQTIPHFKDEWLTPEQAARRFKAVLDNGEKQLAYRMIEASGVPRLVDITHQRTGEEEMEVDGAMRTVTVWTTTTTALKDAIITERYDADGVLVAQEIPLGVGPMKVWRCSKEEALAVKPDGAPELLVSTFVSPDKPIKRMHAATKVQLRLRLIGRPMPELPSTGAQRVEMAEDHQSALVTIAWNHSGEQFKEEPPAEMSEFLASSMMLNTDDERVRELAERAVRMVGDDTFFRAEAMRKFVREHIRHKGLEVAFATASEVARRGRGDCSEHAVLLAAMLRCDNIPSRVAMGLVYADAFAGKRDVFGWHMWTQAWIDDRWIDLDATLNVQFHPGHILTGTSSLMHGAADENFTTLLSLIGQLEIEVVNVEYVSERETSGAR